MKIKDWIAKDVITIQPGASVKEAFRLMKSMGIRHLPVVKDGKICGMVTDRDLRRPKISDLFREWDELYRINDEIQVEDVMAEPVMTIQDNAEVAEAAKLMVTKRIGALPVVNKSKKLVGIISESDILRAFVAKKR